MMCVYAQVGMCAQAGIHVCVCVYASQYEMYLFSYESQQSV